MKKILKYLVCIMIGVLLGILANRNKKHLIDAKFIRENLHMRRALSKSDFLTNSDSVLVFMAIGQSNAANYGNGTYVCKSKEVYNYYRGSIYRAQEPLLGSDGGGSSVWTRLADLLIENGIYKKVLIVPSAIGASSVQCWSEGSCKKKLGRLLNELQEDNIKVSYIFWMQGETDNANNTSTNTYKQHLKSVVDQIQEKQRSAVFYTSITSYFPYGDSSKSSKVYGIDLNITTAQRELANEMSNLKLGPDTDELNLAYYRSDAVHFTEKGLDELAYMWYETIKENIMEQEVFTQNNES